MEKEMITIRELRPEDDMKALFALCKDFFAEYESHHDEFFLTDNLSEADISGRFVESLKSENSATLVAITDNKMVGYASVALREQPRFYKIKKVGVISALMVAKEYRRRGIATKILAEAKIYFRWHGIKYFTFYTAVSNGAAIRLYEKSGMTPLHMSFIGET
jgi:ribosomal protein S18 acetylase RimI-like enzyme